MSKCYLCASTEFNNRPGSARDNQGLELLECASCGLVFLSSFNYVRDGFYEDLGMHGEDTLDIQTWIREIKWDNEQRFQYLKQVLLNCRLLDFGCGAGGFLLKAQKLATTAHSVEPDSRLSSHN